MIGGYGYQPYWGFYGGFGWGYPYYGYGAYGGYYPSYPAYSYYRTYPYYGAPDGAGYATPDQRPELSVNPRTQPPDNGSSEYGALSIRVQPVDAEILIDDEPWATPTGADRVIIEVGEGRHHIEVRKEGFAQYTEDVLVRRNAVFTLNVSLLRGADERK